jgi:hypothetical protein
MAWCSRAIWSKSCSVVIGSKQRSANVRHFNSLCGSVFLSKMAEGQSAATCARWLTRAPFVSVYPGDVVQRVLNVLEIDAVVFHSAAASARIRSWR